MTNQSVEILIVEDDPNDVKLILHAFRRMNLANEVHVARDGVEALEYLFGHEQDGTPSGMEDGAAPQRRPPRVVLLDLKLPRVSGHEVLRRIKSDPRTRMLPVVILTSSNEDRDIVESYASGVNSYIVKPVDFGQFTEAVSRLGMYWLLLNQPPEA